MRFVLAFLLLAVPPAAVAGEKPRTAAGKPSPEAKKAPEGTALTVEECVLIALRNNVDLRQGRLGDRQAELDHRSALAEFLPTLTASGSSSKTRESRETGTHQRTGRVGVSARTPWGTTLSATGNQTRSNTERVTSSSSSLKAEVRQPLLHGAGTASAFYGYRSARRQRVASREDLRRLAQRTAFVVRQLYWSAIKNRLVVQANRRALKSADYFLKATQARLKAERASKLDVSNAEIQRSSREVALTGAEASLESGLDSLKEAMDLSLTEKLKLTSAPAYSARKRDPGELLKHALNRPDLRAARQRLEIKRLDLARKKRNAWPTLDLVAGHTWSGSGEGTDDSQTYNTRKSSIGLELSVPLGLLRQRNDYRKAALELRREDLALHSREVGVRKELRSVLRDLRAAERNLASFEKRVAAARLAAAAASALYERGKASSFDVVRAEDDLLGAELGLARSRADCLTLDAELELVAGRPVKIRLTVERKPDSADDRGPKKDE